LKSSIDTVVEHMIDNTGLVSEFGMQYRLYRERVLQIINDIRRKKGPAAGWVTAEAIGPSGIALRSSATALTLSLLHSTECPRARPFGRVPFACPL
jgi:hypothetical protein